MAPRTPSPSPGPDACRWKKDPRVRIDIRNPGAVDPAEMESAVETAERLLGIGPQSNELAWVRDQVSYYLGFRDLESTEFHPTGHPDEGKPRYRWEPAPGGNPGEEVGWLAS